MRESCENNVTLSELRCREIINLCDGARMGYVSDIQFNPDSGQITLNGQRLGAVPPGRWRAGLAVMPQDTVLFQRTIGQMVLKETRPLSPARRRQFLFNRHGKSSGPLIPICLYFFKVFHSPSRLYSCFGALVPGS